MENEETSTERRGILYIIFLPFRLILNFLHQLGAGTKETVEEAREKKGFTKNFKGLYIMGHNYIELNPSFTKDLMYIKPERFKRLIGYTHHYTPLFDSKLPNLVILHDKNPETLEIGNQPTIDTFEREIKKKITNDITGKEIEVVDMEEYKIHGGDILNKWAFISYSSQILKIFIKPAKDYLISIILATAGIVGLFSYIAGNVTMIIFIALVFIILGVFF